MSVCFRCSLCFRCVAVGAWSALRVQWSKDSLANNARARLRREVIARTRVKRGATLELKHARGLTKATKQREPEAWSCINLANSLERRELDLLASSRSVIA